MIPQPDPSLPGASTDLSISRLLRVGVLASLSLIVGGAIVTFIHHPDYVDSPESLRRLTDHDAKFPDTIDGVVRGLARVEGRAIVITGLLLLIATPVARVAFSVVAFARAGDRRFALIAALVLLLLLLSFVLGRAVG